MPTFPVVQPADLGAEFDVGVVTPNKITVLAATTTVAGKLRLASTSDLSSGTTGAAVDAAALKAAIAAVAGGLNYQGTWNANTNTLSGGGSLTSGSGTKGYYYKVSVAGSTSIDGNSFWNVGDIIAFNGSTYDKIDGPAEAVTMVAGRIGNVVLTAADVSGVSTPASVTAQASVLLTNSFGVTIGHALP